MRQKAPQRKGGSRRQEGALQEKMEHVPRRRLKGKEGERHRKKALCCSAHVCLSTPLDSKRRVCAFTRMYLGLVALDQNDIQAPAFLLNAVASSAALTAHISAMSWARCVGTVIFAERIQTHISCVWLGERTTALLGSKPEAVEVALAHAAKPAINSLLHDFL